MTNSTERIRAEFEKWAKTQWAQVLRFADDGPFAGSYKDYHVDFQWQSWRAATEAALENAEREIAGCLDSDWQKGPYHMAKLIRALKPSADK